MRAKAEALAEGAPRGARLPPPEIALKNALKSRWKTRGNRSEKTREREEDGRGKRGEEARERERRKRERGGRESEEGRARGRSARGRRARERERE